ncbi:MAG: hypothetical protein ACFFCS_20355 [Candidatus Hodarchaeota archaeon]
MDLDPLPSLDVFNGILNILLFEDMLFGGYHHFKLQFDGMKRAQGSSGKCLFNTFLIHFRRSSKHVVYRFKSGKTTID